MKPKYRCSVQALGPLDTSIMVLFVLCAFRGPKPMQHAPLHLSISISSLHLPSTNHSCCQTPANLSPTLKCTHVHVDTLMRFQLCFDHLSLVFYIPAICIAEKKVKKAIRAICHSALLLKHNRGSWRERHFFITRPLCLFNQSSSCPRMSLIICKVIFEHVISRQEGDEKALGGG